MLHKLPSEIASGLTLPECDAVLATYSRMQGHAEGDRDPTEDDLDIVESLRNQNVR